MHKVYSQGLEQQWILNYFGSRVGTFLDLGANDGITLSNTRALSEKGWKGVLVEPSPTAFKRLQANYNGWEYFELYNVSIGKESGWVPFYESGEHLGVGDTSLVSTTHLEEKKRWKTEKFTTIIVNQLTFEHLLHYACHEPFNFVSLDIEGSELDVLPQMDLRALGCDLLCVEWNGQNLANFHETVVPQGYKLLHKNAENLLYAIK